jgi:lipid A 3-O-deacylase
MRHFLLISLLSLPLFATAAPAMQDPACENTTPGKRELHLIFENDVFSEKLGLAHSDRWYTSGVKAIGKINRSDPPWWYSAGWEAMAGKDSNQYCMEYGFTLGQMMFTPMNIRVGEPQPNDRFWGGWLYVGTLLQSRPKLRADAKRGDMETFELDIGVVGPASLAEQSQKGVHALIGLSLIHI